MIPLTQVHIADIHFGSIDPKKQYDILYEQFLTPISTIHFDILSIDGDLFDRKFMANSEAVYYANKFVHYCVMLCEMRQAALIMISGTESHEAGQLSLYKDLKTISSVEYYIVEHIQFIHTHGYKILCIPEEYGLGSEFYQPFLNQLYDLCFMHGTIAGGVYGCNKEDLDARRPVFDLYSFRGCTGPIISGHVHEAMCLKGYMYYVSNPIRYKFGEESDKGYAIVISNHTGHYYQFMPIMSFRYDTIDVRSLGTADPNEIINKINALQASGIDHVRLVISELGDIETRAVTQYYMQSNNVKIANLNANPSDTSNSPVVDTTEEILDKYKGLEFILDDNINEYEKLVRFINYNMGTEFITTAELKQLVETK